MTIRLCFILVLASAAHLLPGQMPHRHAFDRAIYFPDVPGYKTLKCDFHQHTVFSDGSVWPDIRVEEALRDSLDAIALTEHLEYQPHRADIPHPDRNRSFELAEQRARPYENLIVVHGSEITRRMPPGHSNAIFIEDANKLLIADSVEVFREAKRQGAFVFWNHPNWVAHRKDGVATMTDLHRYLIAEGLLDGIEVVNDLTYSDEALQIALDYNLTIMGTSDIHGLVDWQYNIPQGGHRPITLVFATEKTPAAIREALFERRTVAYFNHTLIGREAYLRPLMEASLQVRQARYQGITSIAEVVIENVSDATYVLANDSPYSFHSNTNVLLIKPYSSITLEVKTLEQLSEFTLPFTVLSAVIAPKKHPQINLHITVEP
ncbi:MAG TPA: Sb-PDE family phosphodiesterase [Saprospiraceae bacterium]|nr:Sb-PDE family phosphodiesterase [Saprospiraceae bacterium]HMP24751.1 Sb-PDE family phosphodiesterase [Saprospiraceae bacterium]